MGREINAILRVPRRVVKPKDNNTSSGNESKNTKESK